MHSKQTPTGMYILFATLFILFGLIAILFGGIDVIKEIDLKNNGIAVPATIGEISSSSYTDSDGNLVTSYTVYFEYIVDDKVYKSSTSHYDNTMSEGKKITVYYKDNDPSSAQYVLVMDNIIFIAIFGLIFSGVGVGFGFAFIKHKSKERLLSTGTPIMADVTYCGYGNVTINDRPTFLIKCEWIDENGIKHNYKSGPLMNDPTGSFTNDQIEVYVNPNNYDKFYINV